MSEAPNYPDLLGVITGGPRKNIDVIQCALSSRPDRVSAGKSFEAVLLIQSMIDIEVDVRVEMELPDRDANKKRGVFFSKQSKLLVGLQPAEVGYITLPISCSPHTAPGENYVLAMKIQVKQLSRQAKRIRLPHGGGMFSQAGLPENVLREIEILKGLTFSINDGNKKNFIQETFAINPPSGIASLRELQPGWVSLWTMRDYLDDATIFKRVQAELELIGPQLNRQVVFKPLLTTVQEYFQNAHYKLHVAEAIYIVKMMTLVIEQGAEKIREGKIAELPKWILQMARLLFQEKRFASQAAYLVSNNLFAGILEEAVLLGFRMTATVLNENYGTQEEMEEYADSVVSTLIGADSMDFARTYLPLITAGIIANSRITMPREQVRETLFMISKAKDQRASERTNDNQFVFEAVDGLIQRGLESF